VKFLENKIPPPLVGLLCAGATWYLARHTFSLDIPAVITLMLSIGIGVAGVFVMLAGVLSFRRMKTTISPLRPGAATALVTSGIYRYTRNPMYLGMLLLLIGWGVYLSSPAAFVGVVVFWLYIGRFQIRPEERALETLFGNAYSDYVAKVRRWF
jgi:protein-S-isoprenylcysteine O-methyltransferase Ste14